MRVEAYWNFHRKLFSVRALEGPNKGRVIAREDRVVLRDVTFRVSEAGRQRVLREKRKNVHATVRGEWEHAVPPGVGSSAEVHYNPYRDERFNYEGRPVEKAAWVEMFVGGWRGGPKKGVIAAFMAS